MRHDSWSSNEKCLSDLHQYATIEKCRVQVSAESLFALRRSISYLSRQQTQFRQRLRLATEDRDNTTAPLYCASKTSRHTHTLSKNVHCWTLSMHHQKFVSRKVACPLDARFSTLRALSGTAAPAACWCFCFQARLELYAFERRSSAYTFDSYFRVPRRHVSKYLSSAGRPHAFCLAHSALLSSHRTTYRSPSQLSFRRTTYRPPTSQDMHCQTILSAAVAITAAVANQVVNAHVFQAGDVQDQLPIGAKARSTRTHTFTSTSTIYEIVETLTMTKAQLKPTLVPTCVPVVEADVCDDTKDVSCAVCRAIHRCDDPDQEWYVSSALCTVRG